MISSTVNDRTPTSKMPKQKFGMDSGRDKEHETKKITSHYNLKNKRLVYLYYCEDTKND